MPPTLADRVRHILEAITDIEAALAGVSYDELAGNKILRAAIERLLEIISEASRHIPSQVKAEQSGIAWQKMADFGNRLRHAYHQVDLDIVWRIVKEDIGPLKEFVSGVIREADRKSQ